MIRVEKKLRLGVNIDHVATIRNARGGIHPDPVRAANIAVAAGADGITAHLREDRRHITDADILRLKNEISVPLNFEMAATDEMLAIAIRTKPNAVCLVPEKRQERTTEGGLNICEQKDFLRTFCQKLKAEKIRVSLFINHEPVQLSAAHEIGADIVEFHTGNYCHQIGDKRLAELEKITMAAAMADSLGLECHAGHGLCFETVSAIASIPQMVELNIGHFLIGEAVFSGLTQAIKTMREFMDKGRNKNAAK
jgi:pyridoxine 5-phosphate synthase